MKKYIKYLGLTTLPIVVYAGQKIINLSPKDLDAYAIAKNEQEQFEIISKYLPNDLPKPGSGLVIKKSNKTRNVFNNESVQMDKNEANNALNKMHHFNNIIFKGYSTHKQSYVLDDSVKTLDELPLAFDYMPNEYDKNVTFLGFAPYMSQNKQGEWVGVAETFYHKYLGACTFAKYDYKNTNSSILLDERDVKYLVNGEPTVVSVHGQKNKGFMYNITWIGKVYNNELECANKINNAQLMSKMLELAKNIGKQQK